MTDSSEIFGDHGAEECQSSESGWTMYIGSPLDGEVEDDDDGMKSNVLYQEEEEDDDDGDGSDDSMASDASSGPSQYQQQQPWESNGEISGYSHVMAHKYHQDDKKYSCSKKNVRKQLEKKKKKKTGVEARKETKEECLFTEKRGIVTVQSGNKAWYLGQRK